MKRHGGGIVRSKLFSVSIQDCKVDTFTCGGKGGSGKDTSNNGVRVTHPPSGAVGEGRRQRHQLANKRAAFTQMAKSIAFTKWAGLEASRLSSGKSISQLVEESMEPENLKIEVRDAEGKWIISDS